MIVPVYGRGVTLPQCLAAIAPQLLPGDELIVVDDESPEPVGPVAARFGAVVHRLAKRSGPAAARNQGTVLARGDVLGFFDADVVPHADVLARVRERLRDASVGALIGSYDERPSEASLVSRFKNLAHCYFHQEGAGDVSSFWGACGFVRRERFVAAGGFDAERYPEPSIEDVELGWRLGDRGTRIVLDPHIQVTHLKRWTLGSLVATDTLRRAAPWVQAALERGMLPGELNATGAQRLALMLSVLWTGAAVGLVVVPGRSAAVFFALVTLAALVINRRLFTFLRAQGGSALAAAGFFLQQLYYLCALTGTAIGVARYAFSRRTARGRKALGHA